MEIPQVQFLENVVDVPVVCDVRCFCVSKQKIVEVPQLPSRVGLVQFLDKVADMPVVVLFFDKVVDVPCCAGARLQLARCGADRGVMPQIIEIVEVIQLARWRCRRCSSCGFGRPYDHAATLGLATVKVPQIQFIARVRGQSSCATENGTRLFSVVVMAVVTIL